MSRADSDIYEIWNIGDKIFDFFMICKANLVFYAIFKTYDLETFNVISISLELNTFKFCKHSCLPYQSR